MGAGNASTGGGGSEKTKFGYSKPKTKNKTLKDLGNFLQGGALVGGIYKSLKLQKKASKQNMMDYEGAAAGVTKQRNNYDAMREREAMGGGTGGDPSNPQNQVTKNAPTTAEVDQATVNTEPTETAETTEANRLLKIKKRGRSASIMNSPKGVTKTSSDYSLGKKSLLGMV